MNSVKWIVAVMLFCGITLSGCGGGGGGGGDDSSDAGGSAGWLIPSSQVVDGGPGKDGIPALNNPQFVPVEQGEGVSLGLVIGILDAGEARAIPHDIMDWHEVLNTTNEDGPVVVSYCPLTGSALLWEGFETDGDPTFGVSGLLYNSNLILYDRETDSNWSQMSIQAVEGERRNRVPTMLPLVEMTIESWREMYPTSTILSRETGFSRDYNNYPYGSFRSNTELLFGVTPLDTRLHEKTRVLGVAANNLSRAYVINDFEAEMEVINDDINGEPVVVVGSKNRQFAVSFERTLADGTVLTFLPSDEPLPSIVSDNEGNTWDVFGRALTGTRAGQRLTMTESHIAYWFAWGAFHPDSEIYER